MDLSSVKKAYRFYAPVYDFVFGWILAEGRKVTADRLSSIPGGKILEIGVGTGLSFPYYQENVEVTGIDVTPEMLEVARRRTARKGFRHVKAIEEMDAQDLSYADNSFDGVVAMYVASVVPDLAAMTREMFRVARPGAPVIFVNHFSAQKKGMKTVETVLAPLAHRIGFHSDFPLDQFLQVVGQEPEAIEPMNLGGYWTAVTFRKNGQH
jgi:phosphatidylethanolamine/phosphatidyl-N-methylethanolamine N-methyltransferase